MELPSWPKARNFVAFTFAFTLTLCYSQAIRAQVFNPFPEETLPGPAAQRQSLILPGKSNFYAWSAAGWTHQSISAYTYDGSGNTINILETDANNNPEQNIKQEYDGHNNQTLYLTQTFVNNHWQNQSGHRYFYTYSADGKITEQIRQEWLNGNWENKTKQTITYTNQLETDRTLSIWHNGNWHFENRYLSNYQNGFLAGRISQKFVNNAWENEVKFTSYTWDTQLNKVTGYTQQEWQQNAWADMLRFSFTYGPNESYERITEEIQSGNWVNSNRVSGSTDAQRIIYNYRNESWQNGAWQKQSELQTIRTYDSNQVLTTTLAKKWNPATGILENDHLITYYDFSIISGVKPSAGKIATGFFPNPVQDILTISLTETQTTPVVLQIVNLTGQVLLKQEINITENYIKIPTEGLANGIFLVQLQAGNRQQTFKIIKH